MSAIEPSAIGDLLTGLASTTTPHAEPLAPDATVLRAWAAADAAALVKAVAEIAEAAPFRQMTTPGGYVMSVAMTNCGCAGWVTDRRGYRYDFLDPTTGRSWPAMPPLFRDLAERAAAAAGFDGFVPDSCLINRYEPGTRLSLHQDRNERDYAAPIVSVSLGLPAVFLFGGLRRADRARRIRLESGDVVVWGGAARLAFHGVAPVAEDVRALTGRSRINLTFRKAL
jgi:alkylated DNA repair protein (DNA oxidative demethylase)